jgi:hypothetical protein
MVCLGNICINTLHKGAKDDDDNDNNNNNNNSCVVAGFSCSGAFNHNHISSLRKLRDYHFVGF